MSPQEKNKIKNQALFTFVPLAGLVYMFAIGYCIKTENTFAVTLLLGASAVFGVMARWVYKSN